MCFNVKWKDSFSEWSIHQMVFTSPFSPHDMMRGKWVMRQSPWKCMTNCYVLWLEDWTLKINSTQVNLSSVNWEKLQMNPTQLIIELYWVELKVNSKTVQSTLFEKISRSGHFPSPETQKNYVVPPLFCWWLSALIELLFNSTQIS